MIEWKNPEGYRDETPAKALANGKPGEIWDVMHPDGIRQALIISVTGDICQLVYVKVGGPEESAFVCPAGHHKVDLRYITFAQCRRLYSFKERLTPVEFGRVKGLLAAVLELGSSGGSDLLRMRQILAEIAAKAKGGLNV